MKINVINQSTPAAVFVKGGDNRLARAIFNGYTRKHWSTAGHINLGGSN